MTNLNFKEWLNLQEAPAPQGLAMGRNYWPTVNPRQTSNLRQSMTNVLGGVAGSIGGAYSSLLGGLTSRGLPYLAAPEPRENVVIIQSQEPIKSGKELQSLHQALTMAETPEDEQKIQAEIDEVEKHAGEEYKIARETIRKKIHKHLVDNHLMDKVNLHDAQVRFQQPSEDGQNYVMVWVFPALDAAHLPNKKRVFSI